MNARSQFARNTFHAYYTVISKSFLSPGTASPAILAAVPCKAGKASETILFAVIYDPPITLLPQLLRFVCTDVTLVCFPCIPSPLFCVFFFSFGIGNLFPFGVMAISLQVCVRVCVCACASAERKQLKARGWRGFKFCLPKTAVFKTRDAWQDNCFLLKGQTQRMQLEFLIITFFFRRGGKI